MARRAPTTEAGTARPSPVPRWPVVLGAGLTVLAAAGVVAHLVPWQQNRLVAAASGAVYLMVLAPVAALLLMVLRRWAGVAVAVLLTAAMVWTWLPLYLADKPPPGGSSLVVLSGNLRLGSVDADALVAAVSRSDADVVMLQELTEEQQRSLQTAGLGELLPYALTDPRRGASGAGMWSRYPLADQQRHRGLVFAAVSARLELGDGPVGPTVLTLHMPGPWPQPATDWLRDMRRLPGLLGDLAADADRRGSSVLVGGDFNATHDTAQFRQLLTDGWRDAAEQSGSGRTPTYPEGFAVPPLIGIDHVLVRDAVARRVTTVSLPGSDHRGLVVEVALPAVGER